MKRLLDSAKVLLTLLVLSAALGGCASARTRPPTATLSPDSLALLQEAIEKVRPAYATQAEALESGAYGSRRVANDRMPELLGVASTVQSTGALGGITADGPWVIQVAAFENRSEASQAALLAEQLFPAAAVIIERSGPYFRVALVGWPSRPAAERNLQDVQQSYSGAWIRTRGVP